MTVENQTTSPWLDRMIWIIGALLVLVVIGFAAYYYYDRYVHPDESLPDRQIRLLEEEVQKNPTDLGARLAVANWYLEEGLYDPAIEQGEEALKLDPGSLDVLILLAQVYQAKGDAAQAIDYYTQVTELNKDNEFAHIDPRMNMVYFYLGELYRQQGEYDKAVEAFKAALAINRTDADARFELGLVYQAQGNDQQAITEFNEVLRYVPDFAEVYAALRESYATLGKTQETAYAEGMMAYSEGDYLRAVEQLQAVVHATPEVDAAYLGLGMVYEKLGQKDDAIKALHRYLEAQPDSVVGQHILGRVSASLEEQ